MTQGTPRPVGGAKYPVPEWLAGIAESLIFLACVLYLVTNRLWALLLWESLAVLYLIVGFIVVWRG